jgi:hypothetical protein
MPTQITATIDDDETLAEARGRQDRRTRWITILVSAVLLLALAGYIYDDRERAAKWLNGDRLAWPEMLISLMMALLPAAICVAQTVTRRRLLAKLDSVNDLTLGGTAYFTGARKTFEGIVPAAITGDYFVPLLMNIVSTFLIMLVLLNGFNFGEMLHYPRFFLDGIPVGGQTPEQLGLYQQGTFAVMGAAFVGNYVYMVSQLLSRVNNHDLFPISLHFYTARAIIAMATACILRHTIKAFGPSETDLVLLLGFAAGLAPDLLIVALSRRAFQYLKVWSSREDGTAARPTSLALLQIDDLTREKIDRLSELGIDSAHALSRQNPFVIWTRLPYDVGLIIDWIAQAQLYVLVRDEAMARLRSLLVTDIFDFRTRLNGESAASVLAVLGLTAADASPLREQIDNDEAFKRLLEVRQALLPANYRETLPAPSNVATLTVAHSAG